MNISAERATITMDELSAVFKESRLKFIRGYGLLTALDKPAVRWSLEMMALSKRKNQQQHGQPAPGQRAV